MNTQQAIERLARAGTTPRLQRWATYRASVRSEQYSDRAEWWACVDADGKPVLSRERQPLAQTGDAGRMVRQMLSRLLGTDTAPDVTIRTGPPDAEGTPAAEVEALRPVLDQSLDLPESLVMPLIDLLGGACVLVATRPDPNDRMRRELLRLQPEWCDRVLAPEARGAKARAYAAQLVKAAEAAGADLGLPSDEEGPFLPVPPGAQTGDVVFLREQVRLVEEIPVEGVRTETRVTWRRTDYLPSVIIEYAPVTAARTDDRPPEAFKVRSAEPHGWDVPPAVWITGPFAEDGELDGVSLLHPAVLTLVEQADYALSFAVAGTNRNADPDLVTIDLASNAAAATVAAIGEQVDSIPARTTGGKVMHFTSTGNDGKGEIKLLESTGSPGESSRDQVRQLRQIAADASGVSRHDPETATAAMSGEALKRLLGPELALADLYRQILSRGLRRFLELLVASMTADGVQGLPEKPVVEIVWPEAVPTTAADAKAWADVGVALAAAGFPRSAVVRYVAGKVGFEDPEAVAAEAEAEQADTLAQMRDAMNAPPPDPQGAPAPE